MSEDAYTQLFGNRPKEDEPTPLTPSQVIVRAYREGGAGSLDVTLKFYMESHGLRTLGRDVAKTLIDLGEGDYVKNHQEMFED